MNWIDKIKTGARFKDKHGNVYFLRHKKGAGLFGNDKGTYSIVCSDLDKGRGECMFHDDQISVYFKFLGLQKWVIITENKIEFIN